MPGIGSDIADPDVVESAYEGTPLRRCSRSIGRVDELREPRHITCPVLVLTSAQDHVVDPANTDLLAPW